MRVEWIIAIEICLTGGLLAAQTANAPATPPKEAKPESKAPAPAPATAAPGAAAPAAAPSSAAGAAAPAGVRADSPCKQDVEVFCAGVAPGGGRIYKCLADKESELSNVCKKRLADLRATGAECKEDIEKLCASVPHAAGRLAGCLTQHHEELSAGCKALSSQYEGGTAPAGAGASVAAASAVAPQEKPASPAADAGTR